MTDIAALREECSRLSERLERDVAWSELNAIYLELAPLIGKLQGAVGEHRGVCGDSPSSRCAEDALDRLKRTARQIGLDMRLASPAATAIGLQTAMESARETIDCLEQG